MPMDEPVDFGAIVRLFVRVLEDMATQGGPQKEMNIIRLS